MRINRTLLDDLEKIYYSLKCENEDNTVCTYCEYCKNKHKCFTSLILSEDCIYCSLHYTIPF